MMVWLPCARALRHVALQQLPAASHRTLSAVVLLAPSLRTASRGFPRNAMFSFPSVRAHTLQARAMSSIPTEQSTPAVQATASINATKSSSETSKPPIKLSNKARGNKAKAAKPKNAEYISHRAIMKAKESRRKLLQAKKVADEKGTKASLRALEKLLRRSAKDGEAARQATQLARVAAQPPKVSNSPKPPIVASLSDIGFAEEVVVITDDGDLSVSAVDVQPYDSRAVMFYPPFRKTIPVYYTTSATVAESLINNVMLSQPGSPWLVLGFDVEWKPNTVKKQPVAPIALMQLFDGKNAFVFQVCYFDTIPKALSDLLANPRVIKAGVGITEDAARLQRDFGVSLHGFVELQSLAPSFAYQTLSLSKLSLEVSNLDLPKNEFVTRSNWEQPLGVNQLLYAVSDAYASYSIFASMFHNMRKADSALTFEQFLLTKVLQKPAKQTLETLLALEASTAAATSKDVPVTADAAAATSVSDDVASTVNNSDTSNAATASEATLVAPASSDSPTTAATTAANKDSSVTFTVPVSCLDGRVLRRLATDHNFNVRTNRDHILEECKKRNLDSVLLTVEEMVQDMSAGGMHAYLAARGNDVTGFSRSVLIESLRAHLAVAGASPRWPHIHDTPVLSTPHELTLSLQHKLDVQETWKSADQAKLHAAVIRDLDVRYEKPTKQRPSDGRTTQPTTQPPV